MSKMRCFKMTDETRALLAEHNANLTQAIRAIAEAWDQADRPPLPEADAANGVRVTQRQDDATWDQITAAGDGNASAGVRRLAAWWAERDDGDWGEEPVLADEALLAHDWEADDEPR